MGTVLKKRVIPGRRKPNGNDKNSLYFLRLQDSKDPKFGVMDSSMSATSEDQAIMQVHTSVPSEEARTRGCEGLWISASEAFNARDISVVEMAHAIPRSEMLHTG